MESANQHPPGRGLEGIIGVVLGLQEIQRYNTIVANAIPPIDSRLEAWYWSNSGDFFQGYGLAFGLDVLAEYFAGRIADLAEQKYGTGSKLYRAAEYIQANHIARSIGAAALSSGAVVAAETLGILNYPMLADIPAGIAGALLYVGIRAYVTQRHGRLHKNSESAS